MLLCDYIESRYLITRALVAGSEYQIRHSAAILEAWMLREDVECRLSTIDELLLSRWIKWAELLYSPRTVAKMRGDVLGVLNDAADAGLRSAIRPRRVRCPPLSPPMPRATPVELIQQFIVKGCRRLDGKMKTGVRRAHYLETCYRSAWRTGLRKGDLQNMRMEQILPDGRVWTMQRKVRRLTIGRLRETEIAMLRAIGSDVPLSFPHAKKTFYDWSREAMELAGLDSKSLPKFLQQFRISVYNHLAKIHGRKAASEFIGHSGPEADIFYADELFLRETLIEPCDLRLDELPPPVESPS